MARIPALRIQDFSKQYGSTKVVEGLSLQVEEGEIFGLLGPNGAGKSTTIQAISGVIRFVQGKIEVFGHDNLKQYKTTRRLTGVMHQEIVIEPSIPVGRILELHSGFYGIKDDPVWRKVLIERLDLGPHLAKTMNRLSGGMKRRLMVAKALIHRPRLLILDEPTAGVDVELRRSLWEFVREINRDGTAVLLTTHYLEEAEVLCSRIAILDRGQRIAMDDTAKILANVQKHELEITLERPCPGLIDLLGEYSPKSSEQGTRWVLYLNSPADSGRVLEQLYRNNAVVCSVETRQPRLEDAFLKLTHR